MTTFDDRERGEEQRFKHSEELRFKARNRRNRLFGLWVAENHLGLKGDEASSYATEVVMADFESPGDDDMLRKVKTDLEKASVSISDHLLMKHLGECEQEARKQVMSE